MAAPPEDIGLSDMQIERQLKRLRDLVFLEYEVVGDNMYQGEIHEDVLGLIRANIPVDTEISQLDFISIVNKCALDLVDWVEERDDSIDKRVVTLYSYDFVNQSLGAIYDIHLTNTDDDDNPMYG